jgi:hypothetical protein
MLQSNTPQTTSITHYPSTGGTNMKQLRNVALLLMLVSVVSFSSIFAQTIEIPLTTTMDGAPQTHYFGVAPGMTRCLSSTDVVNGHAEGELPPFPPQGVPEIRFVYFSTGADGGCFGQGTPNDYRPFVSAAQRDTFKLKEQAGGSLTGTITWPNLSAYCQAATMKYTGTSGTVTLDMMTTNSLDMSDLMANADPATMTIYINGWVVPMPHFSPAAPAPIAFGSVTVGNTVHQNFTVTNDGAAALNISGVASGNPVFSVTPTTATVAVGGNQVFDVAFAPTALGPVGTNITFTHDGSNGPTTLLAVSGIGTGAPTANPDPVAFGNVYILASATQTLTVGNGGATPYDVTGIVLSSQFTLAGSPTFPVTIPGGGNTTFQITYTPTAVGPVSGATAVISHTSAGPALTVGLTGTGMTAFSVAPAGPLTLANVVIGDPASTTTVTVANASTGAMNVSAAVAAPFSVSPAGPVAIPGGGNQVFTISFAPTVLGPASGSVVFTHDGGGSPASVAVSGSGVGQFTAAPDPLAFGGVPEVPPGSSVTLPVTVTNNAASASLIITNVTLGDAMYSVTPTTATIAPGGNQVFNVTFTPSGDGPHNTALTFAFVGGPGVVQVTGSSIGFVQPRYVTFTGADITQWVNNYYQRPAPAYYTRRPSVPNWVNMLQQVVVRGGFAPGTSESDAKGGMVVGTSFLRTLGTAVLDKPMLKDTAWVRLTGYISRGTLSLGYSYQQIQLTLLNAYRGTIYTHDANVRGLDSTLNPGDMHRYALRGRQSYILPRISKNMLFAEQVALKLNIVAAQMGYTNLGVTAGAPQFDQLVYTGTGTFNGMSIGAIAAAVDNYLTFWQGHATQLADAYATLHAINRAFPTYLDTTYSVSEWQLNKTLKVKGTVGLGSVPFLARPVLAEAPVTIPEINNLFESGMEDVENAEINPVIAGETLPATMNLYQNYPNPFNPSTTLSFNLMKDATVTVKIYNVLGQEVATLLQNEMIGAGLQTFKFDASNLTSGVYLYTVSGVDVESGAAIPASIGKMMLLK